MRLPNERTVLRDAGSMKQGVCSPSHLLSPHRRLGSPRLSSRSDPPALLTRATCRSSRNRDATSGCSGFLANYRLFGSNPLEKKPANRKLTSNLLESRLLSDYESGSCPRNVRTGDKRVSFECGAPVSLDLVQKPSRSGLSRQPCGKTVHCGEKTAS